MGADDLDWKGWLVIAGLIVAFLIMGADKVGPDIVFSVLLTFFVACGVLTVNQAAAGYANSGLLTVIFLYLVSEGIYQTGGLESLVIRLLGRSRSPWWALVRMMIPAMILSAFLNNTPVVALLTPILISWARRSGVPVKKLLMPLSIASVLGGTCTLIGTSTNLVISGAQATRYEKLKKFDDVKFRIFDIAPYGVPYAIWGFLFVIMTQVRHSCTHPGS
ncbi:CitMHS domain-containing protein, partial [Haematococcus lacustris]